jgi:hypothetical protein
LLIVLLSEQRIAELAKLVGITVALGKVSGLQNTLDDGVAVTAGTRLLEGALTCPPC